MSDYSQFVPEYIRTLSGYTPGKSRRQAQQESHVNCIKLASNENPFGPSPRAVQAMQAAMNVGFPPAAPLLVLAAYALVFGYLAKRFFRWE